MLRSKSNRRVVRLLEYLILGAIVERCRGWAGNQENPEAGPPAEADPLFDHDGRIRGFQQIFGNAHQFCRPLVKDGEIQLFAWPEPDHMPGVIGQIVPSRRMNEDREISTMNCNPCSELSELIRRDCQLAAAARVRAGWFLVEVSDL